MKLCSKCGAQQETSSLYCTACGQKFESVSVDAAAQGTAVPEAQIGMQQPSPQPTVEFPQNEQAPQAGVGAMPSGNTMPPNSGAMPAEAARLWWVWVLAIFGFLITCCIISVVIISAASNSDDVVDVGRYEQSTQIERELSPELELALEMVEAAVGYSAYDMEFGVFDYTGILVILVDEETGAQLAVLNEGEEQIFPEDIPVLEADLINWRIVAPDDFEERTTHDGHDSYVLNVLAREADNLGLFNWDLLEGASGETPTEVPAETSGDTATETEMTVSQQQAIRSAESYLRVASFSRSGLIDQLKFEDFSVEDATFAVDSLEVDWGEQAVDSAENYLEFMSFSRQGLIDQLIFEGFTEQQAIYGVDATGL
ncbi:MAG: Ltp family lipoprotein [Coriobacteriia bacterium]|nr:Ltp family lipoprotein [Coriobacteriia bacterium]